MKRITYQFLLKTYLFMNIYAVLLTRAVPPVPPQSSGGERNRDHE